VERGEFPISLSQGLQPAAGSLDPHRTLGQLALAMEECKSAIEDAKSRPPPIATEKTTDPRGGASPAGFKRRGLHERRGNRTGTRAARDLCLCLMQPL